MLRSRSPNPQRKRTYEKRNPNKHEDPHTYEYGDPNLEASDAQAPCRSTQKLSIPACGAPALALSAKYGFGTSHSTDIWIQSSMRGVWRGTRSCGNLSNSGRSCLGFQRACRYAPGRDPRQQPAPRNPRQHHGAASAATGAPGATGAMPPPTYRDDSIVAEGGRPPNGWWEILHVPWSEDVGDIMCDIEVDAIMEVARNKQEAMAIARRLRREHGGCWYIRHALVPPNPLPPRPRRR